MIEEIQRLNAGTCIVCGEQTNGRPKTYSDIHLTCNARRSIYIQDKPLTPMRYNILEFIGDTIWLFTIAWIAFNMTPWALLLFVVATPYVTLSKRLLKADGVDKK